MKSRRCPPGKHEYESTPHRVDAVYQTTPNGERVDGRWLSFRCARCRHTHEEWESDPSDPRAAQVVVRPWADTEEDVVHVPQPSSIWERPVLLWILIVVVAAFAA